MLRRGSLFIVALAVPMIAGCPKKEAPPAPDSGPPPIPEDTGVIVMEPIIEDSGPGDSGAKKAQGGPAVNQVVSRLKQCCNALSSQAKQLGPSPEGGMIQAAAVQCNAVVSQVGPSGNAPELGALKGLLQGRNVPPICQGF